MENIRTTKQGSVLGFEQDGVQIFYGIPYGTAQRFSKPEEPAVHEEVRDCTKKEEVALQNSRKAGVIGKEDCLDLDVYTKKNSVHRPVLVYLHGGNNQTGSSFELSGEALVDQLDVVFVSLNHRLGLLGMNCLPCLTMDGQSGNFTLLDIACALRWIRENIEEFGGDKDNVTISGFSAGGRNCMAMLYSPLFKGLFHRAVVFSGGMTMCDPDRAATQTAWLLRDLAVEDGKAENQDKAMQWLLGKNPAVKEWLVAMDGKRLAGAVPGAGIRMALFPHLFMDGITLPQEGFDAPCASPVPVLLLTATSEFSMFCAFDPLIREDEESVAFALKYGSQLYRYFNTQWSAEKMVNPTYAVQIEYGGEASKTKIPVMGSFHGIFMGMLGHAMSFVKTGPGYEAMKDLFLQYLAGFLETGDPNAEHPEVFWPLWQKESRQTLCLDGNEEQGTASAVVKSVVENCTQILEAIELDRSLSEEKKRFVLDHILNGRWFSKELDERFETPSLWH